MMVTVQKRRKSIVFFPLSKFSVIWIVSRVVIPMKGKNQYMSCARRTKFGVEYFKRNIDTYHVFFKQYPIATISIIIIGTPPNTKTTATTNIVALATTNPYLLLASSTTNK